MNLLSFPLLFRDVLFPCLLLFCLVSHFIFSSLSLAFFLCLSLSDVSVDVVWCVVCVVVVVVLFVVVCIVGGRGVCLVCDTLKNRGKNPHVDSDTPPCAHSKRPRVQHWHHVHIIFNMYAWCRYTRETFLNVHTPSSLLLQQTTHTLAKKQEDTHERKKEEKLPSVLLTKICPQRVITCPRGSPKKPPDLSHFENIATSIIERSALARCNILIIRNKNTLQTKTTTRRDGDNKTRTRHQHDDRARPRRRRDGKVHHWTTKRQEHNSKRRHHHTTPTHRTNQQRRATHDMTRHHNTHMHMYMYSVCVYVPCRCSCTCRCLPSLWPSTLVECSQNGTTTSDALSSSVDAHQLKGKRASLRMPPTLVLSACQSVLLLNLFFLLSCFPT